MVEGFQGSLNTGCRVRIHCAGGDPVLQWAGGRIDFDGRANQAGDNPLVTATQTSKPMGGTGSFQIEVRVPDSWGRKHPSLLQQVVDDDWVDVTFLEHGRPTHTMRGQVDSISETRGSGPGGAPSRSYSIQGRDHGGVFDKVPLWFNVWTAENAAGQELIRAFGNIRMVPGSDPVVATGGNPFQTIRAILRSFLRTLTTKGRVGQTLPRSMSPRSAQQTFENALVFLSDDFDPFPERFSQNLQFLDSGAVTLWNLAQEWSDPMFCEMFADLAPRSGARFDPKSPYSEDDTVMAVYFRNRPHPTLRQGFDSLWFRLPTVEIAPEWVSERRLGRGGDARANAFMVSPQVFRELATQDLSAPYWDQDDIRRHGLRLFSVESRYTAVENDLFTMSKSQREIARDFNVLAPYLLSGTVGLSRLLPQARVGMRLHVASDPRLDAYIEQVSHSWSPEQSRTTLTVTRGWEGGYQSYVQALQTVAERYSHLERGEITEVVEEDFLA